MTVREMIETALKMNASDIHFIWGAPASLRVDGDIRAMPKGFSLDNFDIQLAELMPPDLSEAFGRGIDVDFALEQDGTRCRVNMFRQMGQMGCVMRLLPREVPSFTELGLPSVLRDLSMLPRGLVLLCGPTGSGKTTTLATMIDYANENRKSNIITVEDPIEYVHKSKRSIINQREIGRDVGSFSGALRSAMREDPDIILVGEMRDFETVSAALTAAETGHLVLSTLHTTGAARSVDRIIDVFPPHQQAQIRSQLAGVLKGVITQHLVPKLNGGRVAAFEVMVVNEAIANLIREGKTHQIPSAIQTGRRDGMILLDNSLGRLVSEGEISLEEAAARCDSKSELQRFVSLT